MLAKEWKGDLRPRCLRIIDPVKLNAVNFYTFNVFYCPDKNITSFYWNTHFSKLPILCSWIFTILVQLLHFHKCFPAHLYSNTSLPHLTRVPGLPLVSLIILTLSLKFIFLYDYFFTLAFKNLEEIQKQGLLIICGFSSLLPECIMVAKIK